MDFKLKWIPTIFIFILTIIGGIIRYYNLDWQCLMADEWHTWIFILSNTFMDCIFNGISHPNNSLYYPFAKLSSVLLNEISIYSIRLPSVIIGVLAIPVSYFVGKQYNNQTSGILLSGFIALSFPFIYYSQNARSYMAVLLTFLIFTYFLIKLLHGDTSRKTLIMISISAIFCLYAHQYALIPLVISCILVICLHGKKIWKYTLASILLAIPATFYNRTYIPALFYNSPAEYGSPFWLSWDQIAIMIPSELFGTIWIVLFPLILYSIHKKHTVIPISLLAIGTLTIVSCLPMTFILAMSPRYALLIAPMIFLVAIDPVSDFIETYTNDSKKIALILLCLFSFWAFTFGPWISWTTFNICPLVT